MLSAQHLSNAYANSSHYAFLEGRHFDESNRAVTNDINDVFLSSMYFKSQGSGACCLTGMTY